MVWIETSKKAVANLLEFICEFSKAIGWKVNIKKSSVIWYTSINQIEHKNF